MQDFTITTKLRKSQLARIILFRLYKSPGIIIITFFGLFLSVTSILNYLKIADYHTYPFDYNPVTDFILGLLFLLFPVFTTLATLKKFSSDPAFQQDITYTFNKDELRVETTTFKAEYLWSHIKKQKETEKYLILYGSKRRKTFIDKTKLTAEQLQFIKSKVGE
jgi:phosphotransferase system  glucose/maltose/N-acetylglucosamine-specific IIC component